MAATITGIDFDYHDYDERGDVLLHVGRPKKPPVRRSASQPGAVRRPAWVPPACPCVTLCLDVEPRATYRIARVACDPSC